MRTNFANRTGLRRLGCGAVAAALLLLGSAGTHAQPFASPVGTWDLSVSGGGQRGITFLTFTDDGTGTNRNFTGYELLVTTKKGASSSRSDIGRNTDPYAGRDNVSRGGGTNGVSAGTNLFGFSGVGGPWTFDNKGRIMGFFTLLVGAGTVTTSKVACVEATIPYVVLNSIDQVDYTSVTNISFCFTNEFTGTNQGQQIVSWTALALDNNTNNFAVLFSLTDSNLAVKLPIVTTNAAGLRVSSADTSLVFPYISGTTLSTNAVLETSTGTDVTNTFNVGVSLETTNIANISQGFTTNAISFVGKVSAGRRLTMSASTSYGKLTFNGVPFRTNLTDLSGPWAGNKILGKQKFLELFTLTPSDFPNIYFLDGSGPGFNLAGYAVTTARKKAGFAFYTMPGGGSNILSATLGSLHTGKTIKANTSGIEEPGVSFKFSGEKLNP